MLEVMDLYKTYEGQPLLRGVSFHAAPGETICLLGRSGSGKSTLLRIIAGLETAEAGAVRWQGEDLAGVPVHKRGFGLMFQDYALFPHRSVAENVAFGLRMQGEPRDGIRARVSEALEKVNLAAFANRRVTDLSGGEQQRVALARALAPRPRLLMLDEPLGALDRALREQLQDELRRVLHESGIPAIYVTHDQEEAFALADRLVLLHEGRVEQSGTPAEVYAAPVTPWAAEFLGLTNLVEGEVMDSNPLHVRTALGEFAPACPAGSAPPAGARLTLLLRPSGAQPAPDDGGPNGVRGVVEEAVFRGEHYQIGLRAVNGALLTFMLPQPLAVGAAVCLRLPADAVQCLGGAHE